MSSVSKVTANEPKRATARAVGSPAPEVQDSGGNGQRTDGISIEYKDWRFNVRGSNTEPVLRLNVESRGNEALMKEKTEELLALIASA